MSDFVDSHNRPTRRHDPATASQPVLRTMVVCDLADSTALIDRLGDRKAAALMRKHDRLTRALIDEHHGREIDKTDGYLLLFERPTQAVSFALAYQRGLQFMSEAEEIEVRARVGIHVGDVVMWENSPEDIARGAKPVEVEGLAKPVAARLASLARPKQILLSGVAASIARRGHEEIAEDCPDIQWRSHGPYQIRGSSAPVEVVQIGETSVADFATPKRRAIAHRILPWWRRTSTLSAAGFALAVGIGLTLWLILRQPPTIAFAARDWVVIADVQNQTGQSDYDKTIDTALRLGLQQSRYVNVISTSKVQQTLALMKRDSATQIDAKIGAEIAQRDNARALIVPSIGNAGNGVVLRAKLVNPKTQQVIKTVHASAKNSDEVVAAVDTLVRKLRENLGESLSQIKSTSSPLEQVTTSNLNALRAYSLSDRANAKGNYHLSLDFLNRALELDPKFSAAYAAQAVDFLMLGQTNQAQKSIQKALQHADRLSPLERLKLNAKIVTIHKSKIAATNAWKALADLYPDDPAGANNAGLYMAAYLNDCPSALPYLRHAANIPQSLRPVSIYAMATCELATGKVEKSVEDFKAAYNKGFQGKFLGLADAYVEMRKYDKATEFLEKAPVDSDTVVSLATRRALVAVDQGDLASAESYIRHGLDTITPNLKASQGWALRLDLVGILWAQGKNQQALQHSRNDLKILLAMPLKNQMNMSIDYPTLVASYSRWVARLGDENLARRAIKAASSRDRLRGNPIRAQLVAVAQAELALHEKHPDKAVRIASAADTHPIWELLEILARAKAAAGNPNTVEAYTRAIKARPLAFGQLYENELGICTRAIQWNLATLDVAKKLERKSPTAASKQASMFLDHWRLAPKGFAPILEAKKIAKLESLDQK